MKIVTRNKQALLHNLNFCLFQIVYSQLDTGIRFHCPVHNTVVFVQSLICIRIQPKWQFGLCCCSTIISGDRQKNSSFNLNDHVMFYVHCQFHQIYVYELYILNYILSSCNLQLLNLIDSVVFKSFSYLSHNTKLSFLIVQSLIFPCNFDTHFRIICGTLEAITKQCLAEEQNRTCR